MGANGVKSCPACGHQNRGKARYCGECGARLVAPWRPGAGAVGLAAGGAALLGIMGIVLWQSGRHEEPERGRVEFPAAMTALHLACERRARLDDLERGLRRYFGPEAARVMLEQAKRGKTVGLEVREAEMTVMFVDMAGFSAFARGRSPREVVALLNPYFELVSRRVQEHGGHVDKFIGDAVMAVFGAHPFGSLGTGPAQSHAAQAVRAAQCIVRQWTAGGAAPPSAGIHLRIGVGSGKGVVGNVGFPERMEYSVMGDTVNLAARLEKLAPMDGIAASERTFELLGGAFPCSQSRDFEIAGFGRVKVYAMDVRGPGA